MASLALAAAPAESPFLQRSSAARASARALAIFFSSPARPDTTFSAHHWASRSEIAWPMSFRSGSATAVASRFLSRADSVW